LGEVDINPYKFIGNLEDILNFFDSKQGEVQEFHIPLRKQSFLPFSLRAGMTKAPRIIPNTSESINKNGSLLSITFPFGLNYWPQFSD
jgi:hypothetical protein